MAMTLRKATLSQYLRTRCDRMLACSINEQNPAVDTLLSLPARPGLAGFRDRGSEFEQEFLQQLSAVFPERYIDVRKKHPKKSPNDQIDLTFRDLLAPLDGQSCQFFHEPGLRQERYEGRLLSAMGLVASVMPDMKEMRPDLVLALPADNAKPDREILASGQIRRVGADDKRIPLCVIDIKFAQQLNVSYAGEVCLYSMVLAAWLSHPDIGLDGRFYVSAIPAVLVRHGDFATKVPAATASMDDRMRWFGEQLDPADAELYAPPVVRFFTEDLPRVIANPQQWRALEWQVTPSCSFCDYLGYPGWSKGGINDAVQRAAKLRPTMPPPMLNDYCYEDARAHQRLQHVPNLTRGMLRTLEHGQINGLPDLRTRHHGDKVFGRHNGLRIESMRLPLKAGAIIDQAAHPHPAAVTGQMARYANMMVTVCCFFDPATNLLTSLAMGIDYQSPAEWTSPPGPDGRPTAGPQVKKSLQSMWVMDKSTPDCEGTSLLDALRFLSQNIDYFVNKAGTKDGVAAPAGISNPATWGKRCREKASIQVLFWDQRQEEAFREAIGRHLHEIVNSKNVENALIWLFPPKEVVISEELATTPATCHLHDVVTRLLALPTMINDDILSVAEHLAGFKGNTTPYLWDPVAGVIPKERSLEITQCMPPKKPPMTISQCIDQYRNTLRTLIHALRNIAFAVQRNYRPALKGDAPRICDLPPTQYTRVAADSLLWLTHQKVSDGVSELERLRAYTCAPHELEARYQALRVHGMVTGSSRDAILQEWRNEGVAPIPAVPDPRHLVFKVLPSSRHVKFKNESGFMVLLPEDPPGAGLMNVIALCRAAGVPAPDPQTHPGWSTHDNYKKLTSIAQASLVHFDRDRLQAMICIDWKPNADSLHALSAVGAFDLQQHLMLIEGNSISFFEETLDVAKGIGNPPIAIASPATSTALVEVKRAPGKDTEKPAARVLWQADQLVVQPTPIPLAGFDSVLDKTLLGLPWPKGEQVEINDSQRDAIRAVIARRLMPVWGGPGTGKTQTLATAIMLEMMLLLKDKQPHQRIYVTGPTYRAVAEVAARVARFIRYLPSSHQAFMAKWMKVSFLASSGSGDAWDGLLDAGRYCGLETHVYRGRDGYRNGSRDMKVNAWSLRERLLANNCGVELVFGVTKQSYVIGKGGRKNRSNPDIHAVVGLFDRIYIDESSQVSVADSLATLALLDSEGRLALFGDPMQMPPIQAIEPPRGAEYMVGSLHEYLRTRFKTVDDEEQFLKYNYRSNARIVEYARMIGYRQEFESKMPDRALPYQALGAKPANWPATVPWHGIYDAILNGKRPCVTVTYDDGISGQANLFESSMVAGTVLAYRAACRAAQGAAFNEAVFWNDSLGIVTPHRAQRSTLVELLRTTLAHEKVPADYIEDAVDTVERFQGGERDLILVSFGVGDPDLIRSEEGFLFQKQRINVAISRARAKAVLFISRDMLMHLPEEKDVIEASMAIKSFAYQLTSQKDTPAKLVDGNGTPRAVEVRYIEFA